MGRTDVDHLKDKDAPCEVIQPEQKSNDDRNHMELVRIEQILQNLRKSYDSFQKFQRLLKCNTTNAIQTRLIGERLYRMIRVKLVKEEKMKRIEYDLEEFEQRKLNSELARLRISKEYAR